MMAQHNESMLAVAIVAATGQTLPPNAFARIATWSHGLASVDTGDRSQWGLDDAELAILPIIVAGGMDKASVELEVSLWDRSGEVPWMFDAVAEVSLPPPKDLGTCHQQAIKRTFPLENDGVQIGTLSLCAWIIPQQLEQNTPCSGTTVIATSRLSADTVGVPWSGIGTGIRPATDNNSRGTISGNSSDIMQDIDHDRRGLIERGDDGGDDVDDDENDDVLLFELSASTGSVASTPQNIVQQPQQRSATSTPGPPHGARHNTDHQSESITESTPGASCAGAVAVETAGRRHGCMQQRDSAELRQANMPGLTQHGQDSRPDSRAHESARHRTVQSPSLRQQGPGRASCTDEQRFGIKRRRADVDAALPAPAVENNAINGPPLNLEAPMFPLIPPYAAGSAEVRVLAHSMVIPAAFVNNTTPPYVRFSLRPGRAQIMARTPACRQSTTAKSMSDVASSEADIGRTSGPAREDDVLWPPSCESALEYVFEGAPEEQDVIRQGLALPIGGPDMATMLAGGHEPPMLRLEVVSGRSLGHCDVSLVEALRHPGSAFRDLTMPMWKNWSSKTKATGGSVGLSGRSERENAGQGRELAATAAERRSVAGFVRFDFGVMLVGALPDDVVGLDSRTLALTRSFITVEIMGLREQGTAGGSYLDLKEIKKRSGIVGVGVELVLNGASKVAAFHDSGPRGGEAYEEAQTSVVPGSRNGGRIVLFALCTELEAVALCFVRGNVILVGDVSHRHLGSGAREGGRSETGQSLTIPVSEINDMFDGRELWLAMDSPAGRGNRRKWAIGKETCGTTEGETGSWEVQIKITVSNTVPLGHLHRQTPIACKGTQDSERPKRNSSPSIDASASYENQSLAVHGETTTETAESYPALQNDNFTEARVNVSSLAGREEHRANEGETTSKFSVSVKSRGSPAPGYVELVVSAIHGVLKKPPAPENDPGGCGRRVAAEHCPWRVRVHFSGGTGGDSFLETVPGDASGEGQPPVLNEWRGGGDGVVRWPLGKYGVRAKHAVHWTPRQNVLPTASFDVFRGQVLVAQSVWELAPIILHPGEEFSFLHPCWSRANAFSHQREQIFLEVECVFLESTSSEQQVYVGRINNELRVPRSCLTTTRDGGVLCIQVVDIRRLHRGVRSTLALPFTVAFSLPQYNSTSWNSGCAHCIRPAEKNGIAAGPISGNDGQGAGNLALLRIEPRRRGSVIILATLLRDGEDSRDKYNDADEPAANPSGDYDKGCNERRQTSCNQKGVVGTTWLPVSDGVTRNGRLLDSWYPLRMERSSTRADRACELRLRIHYIPNLQWAFESRNNLSPRYHRHNAPRLTLVLEEGRALTHPDLLAGPRELFAEVSIQYSDLQNEDMERLDKGRATCCNAWRAERVVGPLPIQDAANVYGNGNGASPRWNHRFEVPLPVAMVDAYLSESVGSGKATPLLGKPMLTIAIKSAASRVVDSVPNNPSSSWSRGVAGERVVERCVVIGMARIRLPPSLFQREKQVNRDTIRGWYGIKGDDDGALRGKVRVSVYPLNWSSNSDNNRGKRRRNGGSRARSNRKTQTKTTGSAVDQRVIPKGVFSSGDGGAVAAENETLAGHDTWSDSSDKSGATNEAAALLNKAGGGSGQCLDGRGLLLVSVNDLDVRFSGGKRKSDVIFTLKKTFVSIRHATSTSHPSREVQMEACLPPEDDGEDEKTAATCARGVSATLAVGNYSPGKNPVLYVRVSITAGSNLLTTYHGNLDLASCLSSVGLPIQGRKGLMKIRGLENGESCSSDVTSSDSIGSEIGGRCSRGSPEIVMLNITTTFVPHTSGVLSISLPKLRLMPPCPQDLALMCALTELRAQSSSFKVDNLDVKDAAAGGDLFTHEDDRSDRQAEVGKYIDGRRETSSAFLRVRVLPSGPWACSPLFDVVWPRPADWGRGPTTAGVTSLPEGEAVMTLEVDTSIHTISRGKPARPRHYVNTPVATANKTTVSNLNTVEAPTLEVCLFDNSTSASPCGLLGRGVFPLAPWIITKRHNRYPYDDRADPVEGNERGTQPTVRNVILLEPATGKGMARVVVGMHFAHNRAVVDTESRFTTDNRCATAAALQDTSEGSIRHISDTSVLVWRLKAVFRLLDHDDAGLVGLDALIEAAGKAQGPDNNLVARNTDEIVVGGAGNMFQGVVDSWSTVPRGTSGQTGDRTGSKLEGLAQKASGLLGELTEGLVSWELWAAFVEVFGQASDGAEVTPKLVWQRAMELGHQTDSFTGGAGQQHVHPNTDIDAGVLRPITSETDMFIGGCGDVSRYVNCHTSSSGFPTTNNLVAMTKAKTASATAQNLHMRGDAATVTCATRKTKTKPFSKTRGVHQALERSQRVWPKQRHTLPDQANHLNRYFPRHGVCATSSACGTRRRFSCRDNKGHNKTLRSSTSAPVFTDSKPTPSMSHRPATTEYGPSQSQPERMGYRRTEGDYWEDGLHQQAQYEAEDFSVQTRSTEHQQALIGARREADSNSKIKREVWGGFTKSTMVVTESRPDQEQVLGKQHGTSQEFAAQELTEVRFDEERIASARAMELEASWREMLSAKRKASRYKTGMLEAQSALENERRRMLLLEVRTLDAEGKLLQWDRDRIRQAAKARARMFALDVEQTRGEERLAARQARAMVEATAATILQNIGKGFLGRLRYKVELDRIKALQRACRHMVEAKRSRLRRHRRNKAVVSVQRISRGRLVRKQLAARSAIATKIQTFFRGALQRGRVREQLQAHLRCRVQAAIVLQTSRRRLLSRRGYLELRLATLRVQGCHRRRLARQELALRRNTVTVLQRAARRHVFSSSRRRAATVIGSSYRALVRVRKARGERQQILAAAGVLQLAVRGCLARRRVRQMRKARQRERAAAKMQSLFRGYRLRRDMYRRRLAAAITLQRAIGKISVRLSRLRKRKQQEVAAKKIQQVAAAGIDYRRRLAAAITLQQAIATFSVKLSRLRKRRNREQKVEAAATVLQSVYRGHRARQEAAVTLAKHHRAAVKVQAFFVRNRQRSIDALGENDQRRREQSELSQQTTLGGGITQSEMPHMSQANASITEPARTNQRMEEREELEAEQRRLEREKLQSAVQAVAANMARTGAMQAVDARTLQGMSTLDVDDPSLENELRRSLLSLDGAIGFSALNIVRDRAKTKETADGAVWVADAVEEALNRALAVLDRGLSPPK